MLTFKGILSNAGSSGGVLRNISDTVVAITIPEGAHHLDLMQVHMAFMGSEANMQSITAFW